MKLLQCGVAKSGNFWLYKIIQNIYAKAGLKSQSFITTQPIYDLAKAWKLSQLEQASVDVLDIESKGCAYRISSIFKMPIDNIENHVEQCSHVWTHSAYCSKSKEIFSLRFCYLRSHICDG